MQTVGDLKALADQRLFAGDHAGALHAYAAMVRVQPENLDARLRVADALLALGEVQRAAEVYTTISRHGAHAGYPLRALVAMKILGALEPQLGSLLSGIAELYSVGSDRVGRAVRMSPGDPERPLPEGLSLDNPPPQEQLVEAAAAVASDVSQISAYPEKLPPIPLFSELPAEAFAQVLGALKLVRTRPGDVIITQGAVGQSFFVLARGEVHVTRTDDGGVEHGLAKLGDGSIFGEMALVSATPRSATVTALTDCDLLEFDREALEAAAAQVGTVARALDKFMRERLLSNLLGTAPLFRPLDRKQRLDLMRRFTAHDVAAGTRIIEEGQPGQGLYVILHGEVDVSKIDGEEKVLLATLEAGDVFGEIALLQDEPTTATVAAATNTTVLFLHRDVFEKLLAAVPEIRQYIENLGEERLMDTRILLDDDAEELTDDDMVMV